MKLTKKLSDQERTRLAELEPMIDQGLKTFVDVGAALLEISEKRLYRETHPTFAEYVEARWKMTAARAYQLAEAAEVVKALPPKMSTMVDNERSARELARVPEEKRAQVVETAAANGPVTAKAIKEAAVEVCKDPGEDTPFEPEPEPEEDKPRVQIDDFELRVQKWWDKSVKQFSAADLPRLRQWLRTKLAVSESRGLQ